VAARKKRKKPGPQPLPPGEGKRVPLNMRTTKEVRQKLEEAAAASGRSLTQEVENRIERSFSQGDSIYALAQDPLMALKILDLLHLKRNYEHYTKKKMWDDREVFETILVAFEEMLRWDEPKTNAAFQRKLKAYEKEMANWKGDGLLVSEPEPRPLSPIEKAQSFGKMVADAERNLYSEVVPMREELETKARILQRLKSEEG